MDEKAVPPEDRDYWVKESDIRKWMDIYLATHSGDGASKGYRTLDMGA